MALMYSRLLSAVTLSPGVAVDLSQAIDLGGFRELHFVFTVTQAGEGDAPKLTLKHAAVNEEGAYLDFDTAVVVSLTATGNSWFKVDSFTRWVCWFVSDTLNSDAIVTLDIIAKG